MAGEPNGFRPHSRCLRKGRYSEAGRVYLITSTTYGREPIFKNLMLGRCVVRAFKSANPMAATLAFVIMPDHFHWLLRLDGVAKLSRLVQGVKSVSAHEINRIRCARGMVWQTGFHDHAFRAEQDVYVAARYIVANPLRARLVCSLRDYPLWDAVWI